MERQEERISAVKFAISIRASEEKILKQYSKEEYEKALARQMSLLRTPRIMRLP